MQTVVHKALCNTKLSIVLKYYHQNFSSFPLKLDSVNINQQLN